VPGLGIVNADQARTEMDVATVTLIQIPDVMRVAQALKCLGSQYAI
jgi:hypothetical protein